MIKLRIAELAKDKGLNQSQLQMEAKVTPAQLNRYWHNYTQGVNLVALGKIAKVLGVQAGELIVEVPDEGPARTGSDTEREESDSGAKTD